MRLTEQRAGGAGPRTDAPVRRANRPIQRLGRFSHQFGGGHQPPIYWSIGWVRSPTGSGLAEVIRSDAGQRATRRRGLSRIVSIPLA